MQRVIVFDKVSVTVDRGAIPVPVQGSIYPNPVRGNLGIRLPAEVFGSEESKLAQAIYSNVQEGVVITDFRGRIIAVNPAFLTISDYSEHELVGRQIKIFRSRRHDRAFYRSIRECLRRTGRWEGELWNRRRNGEEFPQWWRITCVTNALGGPAFYVCVVADVSRMHHAQSQLQHLAHHDSLTGLPNRTLLHLRLRHTIERSLRTGTICAVLFLDLDGFKAVNDGLGHHAGDELLRQVSARLRRRIRQNDTLARLGGDEFVIVMEDIAHPREAGGMAASLIEQLGASFALSDGRAQIGGSIGIAVCPEHGGDAESLLRNADGALYDAKGAGRGTWRFHEPTEILPLLDEADLRQSESRASPTASVGSYGLNAHARIRRG